MPCGSGGAGKSAGQGVSRGRTFEQPPHPPGPPGDLGAVPVRQEGGHLRGGGHVRSSPLTHGASTAADLTQGNSFNPVWDEEPFDFPKGEPPDLPDSLGGGAGAPGGRGQRRGARARAVTGLLGSPGGETGAPYGRGSEAGVLRLGLSPRFCLSPSRLELPVLCGVRVWGQEAEMAGGPIAPGSMATSSPRQEGPAGPLTPASPASQMDGPAQGCGLSHAWLALGAKPAVTRPVPP